MTESLWDFFQQDFNMFLSLDSQLNMNIPDANELVRSVTVLSRAYLDFTNNRVFQTYFVSDVASEQIIYEKLIAESSKNVLNVLSSVVVGTSEFAVGTIEQTSSTLAFSGEVFIYTQNNLNSSVLEQIVRKAQGFNVKLIMRDNSYVEKRKKLEQTIDGFIAQYHQQYETYFELAKRCAEMLREELEKDGIKAAVTYRAKTAESLKLKLWKRALPIETGKNYQTIDAIFEDIVDLMGIRIALYYPADRLKIVEIINRLFFLIGEPKEFRGTPPDLPGAQFSGYWATHYRVREKDSERLMDNRLKQPPHLEIQVASILMHAWAEINHNLIYKRKSLISKEEFLLLDQLNGLVIAGEKLLDRLSLATRDRQSHIQKVKDASLSQQDHESAH